MHKNQWLSVVDHNDLKRREEADYEHLKSFQNKVKDTYI